MHIFNLWRPRRLEGVLQCVGIKARRMSRKCIQDELTNPLLISPLPQDQYNHTRKWTLICHCHESAIHRVRGLRCTGSDAGQVVTVTNSLLYDMIEQAQRCDLERDHVYVRPLLNTCTRSDLKTGRCCRGIAVHQLHKRRSGDKE